MAKGHKMPGKLIAMFERNDGGIDWQWRDGAWRPKVPMTESTWSTSGGRVVWMYGQRMSEANIEVVW